MKLLNHKFKGPATAVFYLSVMLGIYSISFENHLEEIWKTSVYSLGGNNKGFLGLGVSGWTKTGLFNEVLTFLIITSGLIASFSKEKIEDELISKMRLESLSVAIVINYVFVLMANLVFFDLSFLTALMAFLFAPLVLFNLIFQFRLLNYYKIEK